MIRPRWQKPAGPYHNVSSFSSREKDTLLAQEFFLIPCNIFETGVTNMFKVSMMRTEQESLFEEVLETSRGSIYRICKAYAADPEDRNDLFQEVMLNVWKSLPGFRNDANLNTWVYRIALNVCLRWKMKAAAKGITVPIDEYRASQLKDDSATGERKERYEQLYSCIAKLNDTDKSLVLLYLDDLSYKMISEVTGLTENHVAVKLKRIREKLFDCITLNN
jgi:RNA polymerase sigma factor (sigma-70 family)